MTDPNHPNDRRDPDHPDDRNQGPGPGGRGQGAGPSGPIGPDHPDHLAEPSPPPHPYYQELEFLTPKEAQSRFAVRYGEDHRPPGRPGFLARRAFLGAGGVPVVQYRLASSAQGDPQAYGLLEREVAASVALERRYGGDKFVGILTRIVGFDLTAAEPFVLYRPPSGRPLSDWAGRLGAEDQERITGQLAMAVRLLGELGLVHRAITPENVRWDGARVRLCEPYAALRAGRRASPSGWLRGPRPSSARGAAPSIRATTCGPSPNSRTTCSPAAPTAGRVLPRTSPTTGASPLSSPVVSTPRTPPNVRVRTSC